MPPRKRAVAEIHEEEVVKVDAEAKVKKQRGKAGEGAIKKANGSKKVTEAEASKIVSSEKDEAKSLPVSKKKTKKSKDDNVTSEKEPEMSDPIATTSVDEPEASPSKRKTKAKKGGNEDSGPVSLSAPPPGGSKMDTLAAPELPKNVTIDDPLTLDNTPKKSGTTRISSWNILSLKSSMEKGLMRYIEAEQADVLILTETKVRDLLSPHSTHCRG
jgi:hypothetical protein